MCVCVCVCVCVSHNEIYVTNFICSIVEPIEAIPNLGGLGLGATAKPPEPKKKKIKKMGEIELKVLTIQ